MARVRGPLAVNGSFEGQVVGSSGLVSSHLNLQSRTGGVAVLRMQQGRGRGVNASRRGLLHDRDYRHLVPSGSRTHLIGAEQRIAAIPLDLATWLVRGEIALRRVGVEDDDALGQGLAVERDLATHRNQRVPS